VLQDCHTGAARQAVAVLQKCHTDRLYVAVLQKCQTGCSSVTKLSDRLRTAARHRATSVCVSVSFTCKRLAADFIIPRVSPAVLVVSSPVAVGVGQWLFQSSFSVDGALART
jgi:hypothetical protein